KQLFALLLLVSLFACKNVEQYKAGIEELGTKWDGATKMVGEFTSMVDGAKAAQMASFDSLKIDSTFMAKLKGADLDKVKQAIAAYQSNGGGIVELGNKLGDFKKEWEAKSAEVTALKDGLAAGKIEGDVAAKIAELSNFVSSSETSINGMKELFGKTTESSKSALDALKAAVSPYMKK
ncbi:MAG: hypothetical protein RLZZ546_290, partial [Bacteroidota bacterium]